MGREKWKERMKGSEIAASLAIVLSLLCLLPVGVSAQAVVAIENASVPPNETTTTKVIAYNVTNLGNFGITVTYDPSVVSVTDVTGGPGVGDFMWETSDGKVRLYTMNVLEIPSLSGDVTLATLTLRAVGAAGSESPLNLEIGQLLDNKNNPIPAIPKNGTFKILTPTPTPTPRTVSVWAEPSTVASGEISTIYAEIVPATAGVQVTFTTNLGIFYESRSDTYSNMTDERGLAIAHLDTTGVSGTATITASEPYGGSSSTQVTISPAITTPTPTPSPTVSPTPTPTPSPTYRRAPGGGVTVDSDGDGYCDSYEIRMGTDPYDRWDYPGASPTPMTVTPSPSPSPSPTPTPSPSPTPTPTLPGTPTPTPTPTLTPSPSPTPPGFEAIFAIACLLSLAYIAMRRRK